MVCYTARNKNAYLLLLRRDLSSSVLYNNNNNEIIDFRESVLPTENGHRLTVEHNNIC